jgi:hypothetical protein
MLSLQAWSKDYKWEQEGLWSAGKEDESVSCSSLFHLQCLEQKQSFKNFICIFSALVAQLEVKMECLRIYQRNRIHTMDGEQLYC